MALFVSDVPSACFCRISQHLQVYSSTIEYQKASLKFLPAENYNIPFLGHKNLYLQGSKIALVRSYLRVTQAKGQVEILSFLVKINFFPIYANNFCDAGQVPILRYFEP